MKHLFAMSFLLFMCLSSTFKSIAKPKWLNPDINFDKIVLSKNLNDNIGKGIEAMLAIDIDSDGDADIIAYSSLSQQITWYQNSKSTFEKTHIIASNVSLISSLTAADLDQDGDMDIISVDPSGNSITWRVNDGRQTFSSRPINCTCEGLRSVYTTDIDNDGDADILTASENSNMIAWYENIGGTGFEEHFISNNAQGAKSVYAADIDGDGDVDVLSASSKDNKISWYENNGRQTFITHIISENALGAVSVFASDVNSDGHLDILSASNLDSKISWYKNSGSKTFVETTISVNVDGAFNVYSADTDSDGDIDIITASARNDKLIILENDGKQQFSELVLSNPGDAPARIFVSDLNADTVPDIISGSKIDDALVLYLSDAAHRFRFEEGAKSLTSLKAIDGTYDNIRYSIHSSEDASLFQIDHSSGELSFIIPPDFENPLDKNNDNTYHLKVRALNASADEHTDIPVSVIIANKEGLVWRKSENVFVKHDIETFIQIGFNRSLELDIDKDGDIDILPNIDTSDEIYWFENNGEQVFSKQITGNKINPDAEQIVVDLDNDGDNDIILADDEQEKLIWYENDGQQEFSAHIINLSQNIRGESYFKARVSAADMDNDGDVDILISNSSNNPSVRLYVNDGTQTFSEKFIGNSDRVVYEVLPVDINNDGYLDIYAVDDSTVYVFKNNGNGVFKKKVIDIDFNLDRFTKTSLVDIDKNGLLDLIVTNRGRFNWLKDIGMNNAKKAEIINIYDTDMPFVLAEMDLDGDNALDLLFSRSIPIGGFFAIENHLEYLHKERHFAPPPFSSTKGFSEQIGLYPNATDLDLDGDMDLVTGMAWLENTHQHQFAHNENVLQVDTLKAVEFDGQEVHYEIVEGQDSALFTINQNTGELTFSGPPNFETPLDSDVDNQYVLDVVAISGEYSNKTSVIITVNNVHEVPIISGEPSDTVKVDFIYNFAPFVTGEQGVNFTFTVNNLPHWANFDPQFGSINGSPKLADVGVYEDIEITVNDGIESAIFVPFSITVLQPNVAPVLSGEPDLSVSQDSEYDFIPVANDSVGSRLTFSIENKPDWMSFDVNNGQLSGFPSNDDVGDYENITISVSDGELTDSLESFILTVINVNDPPTISGSPNTSVQQNNQYDFLPTAIDIDRDELQFSIENKPSWANFDTSRGSLEGRPGINDVGLYQNIVIEVSDGDVFVELPAFSINVIPLPVVSTPSKSGGGGPLWYLLYMVLLLNYIRQAGNRNGYSKCSSKKEEQIHT